MAPRTNTHINLLLPLWSLLSTDTHMVQVYSTTGNGRMKSLGAFKVLNKIQASQVLTHIFISELCFYSYKQNPAASLVVSSLVTRPILHDLSKMLSDWLSSLRGSHFQDTELLFCWGLYLDIKNNWHQIRIWWKCKSSVPAVQDRRQSCFFFVVFFEAAVWDGRWVMWPCRL